MADESAFSDGKKAHKKRHSGVKADKKKAKNKPTDGTKNVKAFAITKARSAEKRFRRKEDKLTNKQHIPLVDRTPEEPPPVLIAIVGPPKVGKSTLITSLIKNFTKTNVSQVNGPITVVTSKKRRITLLECNNDINSMIDVAKCADLVLLMIDASFGFEMEIFEFLNVCQVHGMPKIIGVLNHLDTMKNAKSVKTRKRVLKHRFWTEVHEGAKLFFLSGLIHGEYVRTETRNLGRFISVMKFRPLTWRGTHSYVVADRLEDITNTEHIRQNAKCDRDVVLYGYVRGVPLKKDDVVHIAGLGDMSIAELNLLPDPCPLPSAQKKRNLLEKERLLYAPMSGVGGIVYDKDAVYIELQGSHSHKHRPRISEQQQLVNLLIEKKESFDVRIENQEFRLFSDGGVIKSNEFVEERNNALDSDSGDDDDSGVEELEDTPSASSDLQMGWNPNDEQEESIADSDDDDDDNDDKDDWNEFEKMCKEQSKSYLSSDEDETDNQLSSTAWKEGLATRARNDYLERQTSSQNLMKLVYGKYSKLYQRQLERDKNNPKKDDDDGGDLLDGTLRNVSQNQATMQHSKSILDQEECCFFEGCEPDTRDWSLPEHQDGIRNCFSSGKWKQSEDAEELLKLDDMSDGDSEVYGDFEDLETGEKHEAAPAVEQAKEPEGPPATDDDAPSKNKRKISRVEERNMSRAELMAKKMKLKEKFNAEYDNPEKDDHRVQGDHQYYEKLKADALRQSELNKKELANLDEDARLNIEGYRPGMYVRMNFKNIPSEFVEHFDPVYPLLIGGLNVVEQNVGYITCKVKKHRWYKKILKSGDPLIISLGWRRFQTIPTYAKVEDNLKHRFLKYTPNHVTCSMTFWGPITPQSTGLLALQPIAYDQQEVRNLGFRVAATGSVSGSDQATQIMKKLKLLGTPYKIYQKTAFVQGMFNSTLEVAKFEGAKIKTVSGIRGQIKKAVKPEGSYRATFEDAIVLSDIVMCRTWFKVSIPNFYVSVTNLLLSPASRGQWEGMRTLGQLKREKGIQFEAKTDSSYRPIEREEIAFRPLVIPRNLQKALPYKDKPKHGPVQPKKTLESERIAVVHSPHEQKVAKLMNMVRTNFEAKEERRKLLAKHKSEKYKKAKVNEDFRKMQRQKELKKKVFRTISKMEANNNSAGGKPGGSK